MNIPVLLQAKADILAHPDQCIMDVYFAENLDLRNEHGMYRHIKAGGCGTAGCIAAWILHGAYGQATLSDTEHYARVERPDGLVQQAKSLANLEGRQGDFLFCLGNWPPELRVKYLDSRTPEQAAATMAERIDRFIETEGRE